MGDFGSFDAFFCICLKVCIPNLMANAEAAMPIPANIKELMVVKTAKKNAR